MRKTASLILLILCVLVLMLTLAGCNKGAYVGSKYTGTYHDPSCIWAEEMSKDSQVWFDSIEEAEAAGYEPCPVCNPGSGEE